MLLVAGPEGTACGQDAGSQVQFGVCTSPSNAAMLREAGFHYVEGGVGRDLAPDLPDSAYTAKAGALKGGILPVPVCNGFLPARLKVTGPEACQDSVLQYAETAFRRASAAGVKIVVFGSSAARSFPDEFSRDSARRQFTGLLRRMAPLAGKYGITVAIENLQRSETNFINTLEEALSVIREVGDARIGLTADIFHMMRERESPESIVKASGHLVHCHIAEVAERTAPGRKGDDFRPYFAALKQIGYTGMISIEGSWKPEDLGTAFRTMERQWNETKPSNTHND